MPPCRPPPRPSACARRPSRRCAASCWPATGRRLACRQPSRVQSRAASARPACWSRRSPPDSGGTLMRFPVHIATDMITWQLRNRLRGNQRYPYVLMLEPLHTCNLACLGCSPERYSGDLRDRLSLEQCLEAVDQAGAPVVSICGGEPTIYPELPELIEAIVARKRHIYLCTNGLLLDRFYKRGRPHERVSVNVHLGGMRATHDLNADRPGTFDSAR